MSKQKRIIAAVLAAAMMNTAFTSIIFAETGTKEDTVITSEENIMVSDDNKKSEVFLYGDLNSDGQTDLTDLSYLSLYLLHEIEFTEEQTESADIDVSGEVDIADLAYYKQYVCKDESVIGKLRINSKKNDDKAATEETNNNAAVSNSADVENDICHVPDCGLVNINNKTVSFSMAEALEKAESDKIFDIIARPYIDYDFEYNGKTLNDYYCDLCEERMLPEKLGQLIKDGDSLKYGSMLYEGGTPDGEKWAKELYDQRIAFYGNDFLSKYIVNGEFLRDKVAADLDASYSLTKATDEYNEAFNSYYQYLADNIKSSIPSGVKENEGIILHMTAEEFKNFTPENLEAWTFTLELKSRDDCCLISYDC